MSVERADNKETSLADSTTEDTSVWNMIESTGTRIDDLREITPSISPVFTEDQVRELTEQASDMELLLAHETFKRINERMDALTPEQSSLLISTTASPFDPDVTYTDVLPNLSDPQSDPDHYPIVSSQGHDILFNEGLRLDLAESIFHPFENISEIRTSRTEAEEHRQPSSTSEEPKKDSSKTELDNKTVNKESDTAEKKDISNKKENEKENQVSSDNCALRRSPRKQAIELEKSELPEKRQLRSRGPVLVDVKEKPAAAKQEEMKTELRRSPRGKSLENNSESQEKSSVKGRGRRSLQFGNQGKGNASEQGISHSGQNKEKSVTSEDNKNVRRSPRIQHKPAEIKENIMEKKTVRKKKGQDEQPVKNELSSECSKNEITKDENKERSLNDKIVSVNGEQTVKQVKGDKKIEVGEVSSTEEILKETKEADIAAGDGKKSPSKPRKVKPQLTKTRRSSRIAHAIEEKHRLEEESESGGQRSKGDGAQGSKNVEQRSKGDGPQGSKNVEQRSKGHEVQGSKKGEQRSKNDETQIKTGSPCAVKVEMKAGQASKTVVGEDVSEETNSKPKECLNTTDNISGSSVIEGGKKSISLHRKEINQKRDEKGSESSEKSESNQGKTSKKDGEKMKMQKKVIKATDQIKKKEDTLPKKIHKEKRKERRSITLELKEDKHIDGERRKADIKSVKQVKSIKEEVLDEKKLDTKIEKVAQEKPRRRSSSGVKNIVKELISSEINEEDNESGDSDDNEAMEDDSDYDPDNDPDRVWCICRKPHGNRFMICCDSCEEWFHGDCVGITMAQGRQMEKEGNEYVCPKCKQKQEVKTAVQMQENDGKQKHTETIPKKRKLKMPISPEEHLKKKAKHLKMKHRFKEQEKDSSTKVDRKDREHLVVKARQESDKSIQEGLKVKPEDQVERKRRLSSTSSSESTGFKIPKKVRTTPTPAGYVTNLQRVCIGIGCRRSAEKGSVFCSDECITKHAEHSVKLLAEHRKKHIGYKSHHHKQPTSPTSSALSPWDSSTHSSQTAPEHKERIAVVEKTSGRVIAGMAAPTEADLIPWLQRHPTFEVILPTVIKEEKKVEKKTDKKDEELAIRDNVRRVLKEILTSRSKEIEEVSVSSEELTKYANNIEEELFKYFGDTGHRYKNKYRSLIFNLKDSRNKVLAFHVLAGEATADRLVRMTPEQLASQELTKWRERENKHTLEMIKKDQEEIAHAKTHMVKKTHKGEVEVNEEDLSNLESHTKEGAELPDSSDQSGAVLLIDTTDEHRIHLFDLNCRICTGRTAPPGEPPKRESAVAIVSTTTTIQALAESSVPSPPPLDMNSPDSESVSSAIPTLSLPSKKVPAVWKGFVMMQHVAKFGTNAYCVSGPCSDLLQLLPDTIHVQGRIKHEQVWDYIFQLKSSTSRDVCVIRYEASSEEEKMSCVSLYSYFQSRRRCGVVGNCYAGVKDMYLVPLASHEPTPPELLPFNGPGLEEPRPHMLLGVIVRVKGTPKRHKPLSQRSVSPPAKKRSSSSSVSESLPSTTQSPLRHSPVADIEDIVFQYNTNQSKKAASQATSSPSASTPPSSQTTPSSGTPSMSSATVISPKPSSSLASLEAQRQQLLELQERARQQILQSQYRGSTSQNSSFPSNIGVSLPQLPQTSQSTLSLTQNDNAATQLPAIHSSHITLPSAQVTVQSAADDAPYDPEEDLDLALEDALAKENEKEKDQQLTSDVPVVTDTRVSNTSSVAVTLPVSDSSQDALPRLQATLQALGIPAITQAITTPKKLSEQGEKKEVEENLVLSRTDSQLGGQPVEERKEMQSVPQTSSSSHHQFTESPFGNLQTSNIRQNLPGSGSVRMDNCLAETRQPKEEHASRGLPTSKEHQTHEVCSRDDHRSTGNTQGRNDIEHRPDHNAGKSHTNRLDSRHPHDIRPRDPGNSWRDSRGSRDTRFPHETRYNRDRDSHDLGFTRDRYRGRHDEGQYRDYSDRYRGRDDYGHQLGYPRGDQQRRRSWEDGRYEGYRREKWRR